MSSPRLSKVHSCMSAHTVRCPRNVSGAPTRKRCPACGGQWLVRQGYAILVPHRGDGRYALDQAVEVCVSMRVADARARAAYAADNTSTLVARFVSR